MPSTSAKQHRFMEAVAHNPSFAKKAGVSQSVGKDFSAADKGKFGRGGMAAINKQNTQHGSMDMPFKSLKRFAGMKEGGTFTKKNMEKGDTVKMARGGMPQDAMARSAAMPPQGMPPKDAMAAMISRRAAMRRPPRMGAGMPPPAPPVMPPQPSMGMKKGGKVKRYDEGGVTEGQNPNIDDDTRARARAFVKKGLPEPDLLRNLIDKLLSNEKKPDKPLIPASVVPKPKVVTQKQLAASGLSLRDYMNRDRGLTRRGGTRLSADEGRIKVSNDDVRDIMARNNPARGDPTLEEMLNYKKGGMTRTFGGMHKMPDGKMMKNSAMNKGGMAKYANGGGIESRGKTKGTVIRMASGGSVSSASHRADGIAQRGKTRC